MLPIMRNSRFIYVWIIAFVFFLSLYNFLSVALLKFEEINKGLSPQPQDVLSLSLENLPIVENENVDLNRIRKSQKQFQTDNEILSVDISEEDSEYPVYEEPKIFWDVDVLDAIPKVSKDIDTCDEFSRKINALKINHVEPAKFQKCGRPDNAFAALEDKTQLCIRYRHPHNYLVFGEVLSFHLAKYLDVNVPCVVLSSTGLQNSSIWPIELPSLKWEHDRVIAYIQWVPNLSTFARLQDDSDKESRLSVLLSTVPNLGQDSNGLLWIFDNEPGLLDAYELLYPEHQNEQSLKESKRFKNFHNRTLQIFCIFRKSLLLSVIRLYQREDPVDFLLQYAHKNEPNLHKFLSNDISEKYLKLLKSNFRQRLADVIAHSKWCADSQVRQLLDQKKQ